MIRLLERDLLDSETEAHYAYHKSLSTVTGMHNHDFFEIFLIIKGSLFHQINDRRIPIREGNLVFIRPNDVHWYENDGDNVSELLNLAFSSNTMNELMQFLGDGFAANNLIYSEESPTILINHHEIDGVKARFQALTLLPSNDKKKIKTEIRALLVDIFVRYISTNPREVVSSIPMWLESLQRTMRNKEHFTVGLSRLYELSSKSPEHLSRMFKKHYARTPTEWINELRLQYSANLLVHTDEPVIKISFEAGFENLSHFYHRFKEHFGVSPAQYRRMHRKIVIPS